MTIKYSKKTTFWPVLYISFYWRLHYIKNDADSVFVIISYYPLISISSISDDMSIFTHAAFCLLPSLQNDIIWIRWWICTSQQPLNFTGILKIIHQGIIIISMCNNYRRLTWCWIVTRSSRVTHRCI